MRYLRPTTILKPTLCLSFIFLSIHSSSQTRESLLKQASAILGSYVHYDQSIGVDQKIRANDDCSQISFFSQSYASVSFDHVEKLADVEYRYTNIPWKDFICMSRGSTVVRSAVTLVFSSPVTLNMHMNFTDYYKKNKNEYKEHKEASEATRQVKFIQLYVDRDKQSELLYIFQKLKSLDAGLNPVPAITNLPAATFCEKIPAPSTVLVKEVLNAAGDLRQCERHKECVVEDNWECTLFTAAGSDFNKAATADHEKEYAKLKEYWNHYCYSFSAENSIGGMFSDKTNLLQVDKAVYEQNACWYELAEVAKANISQLNVYNGINVLDLYYHELAEETLKIKPDPKWLKIKGEMVTSLVKRGVKSAQEMVFAYRYDAEKHRELIEAIVCNSKGAGIFAGLGNNPAKYFWYLYNVGLRNFQDAVMLYQSIYNKTLSESQKRELRAEAMGLKLFWD